MRGDTDESGQMKRENQLLQSELAAFKDDILNKGVICERVAIEIEGQRGMINDFENRLRYANDVIVDLQGEN